MIFTTALCRACFQRDYPLLWVHERRIGGNWSFQRLRRRRHVYDHHRVRRSRFSHANVLFRSHRHVRERNHRRIDAQRRELRRRDIDAEKRKEIASAFEEMHKNVPLPFFSREKTRKRKRKKEKRERERERESKNARSGTRIGSIHHRLKLWRASPRTEKKAEKRPSSSHLHRLARRHGGRRRHLEPVFFRRAPNTRERTVTKTNKRYKGTNFEDAESGHTTTTTTFCSFFIYFFMLCVYILSRRNKLPTTSTYYARAATFLRLHVRRRRPPPPPSSSSPASK